MPAEEQTRLQIAHVLFIDIVGYSKLLLKQQSDLLGELNEVVSGTNEFREAESAGVTPDPKRAKLLAIEITVQRISITSVSRGRCRRAGDNSAIKMRKRKAA